MNRGFPSIAGVHCVCRWICKTFLSLLLVAPFSAFALSAPIFLSPTNGLIVAAGQTFTVAGMDGDSAVVRLEFYEDNGHVRSFFDRTGSFAWSSSSIGWHTFLARAVDAEGSAVTSAEVKILVSAPDSLATFFPEFTSSTSLNLMGRASVVSNFLRLTPNTSGKGGAAWFPTKQQVTHGFDTVFQFQITDLVGGGADGIAFVIEGTPTAVQGTGIGYSGITNCLAVEYDTFKNPNHSDPNDNHISVHSCGTLMNTNWENLASLGWTTNIRICRTGLCTRPALYTRQCNSWSI